MLLTLLEATAVFGRTVSFDQSSRDVLSSHHHFTCSRVPGCSVQVLLQSPTRWWVHRFDPISQPDRSAQAVIELREISGLGQLLPNRLPEYPYASCAFTPLESRVSCSAVSSHGVTVREPSTASEHGNSGDSVVISNFAFSRK